MERARHATSAQAGGSMVSYSALIKFAPILSGDMLRDPGKLPGGRSVFQGGCLTLAKDARVRVDHDRKRLIGRVEEIFRHEDVDGPWHCARCTITEPPGWLRRGTPASFGYAVLQRQDLGAGERILRAHVLEVTVCSSAHRAVNPAAQVCMLRELGDVGEGDAGYRLQSGDTMINHEPTRIRRSFATEITIR